MYVSVLSRLGSSASASDAAFGQIQSHSATALVDSDVKYIFLRNATLEGLYLSPIVLTRGILRMVYPI